MRKASHLISIYRVIQLRYFWWNYFLNNLSLLDDLLRLVCLLMVGIYLVTEEATSSWTGGMYIFDETCSSTTTFILLLHRTSISLFFWTRLLSRHTFLLIKSISLFFDPWIFCHHRMTCFRVSGCFLFFFGYCEGRLLWISLSYATRVANNN